jgi:hypothetical protein
MRWELVAAEPEHHVGAGGRFGDDVHTDQADLAGAFRAFTQSLVCSRPTETGRITLTRRTLIVTTAPGPGRVRPGQGRGRARRLPTTSASCWTRSRRCGPRVSLTRASPLTQAVTGGVGARRRAGRESCRVQRLGQAAILFKR